MNTKKYNVLDLFCGCGGLSKGIAMSRDMHFAFDKGFFTINDDYTVVVSEEMKDNWFYEEYNGKQIFVPVEQFYRPNLTYLRHHRENVFNTFRQIRKL